MAIDRRNFLLGAAAALPVAGYGASLLLHRPIDVREAALELFGGLTPDQRAVMALAADHPKRHFTNNDWFVVDEMVGDLLRPAQQELALALFRGLHAVDYADEVQRQIEEDNEAEGVKGVSLAFFGQPDSVEGLGFVFAGRHLTRHWEEKAASPFASGVFMGHASGTFFEEPDHPGNVWWYQGQAGQALYQSLDEPQRTAAHSPLEHLDEPGCLVSPREMRGLAFADLDAERLQLAKALVDAIVVRPFRAESAERASRAMASRGGVEALSIHFFEGEDWGDDGVLDNFEVYGPGFMCAYRGEYHCHSWLRVDA